MLCERGSTQTLEVIYAFLDLWRKHNHQVFNDFLPELAKHLKRPEKEIRRTGIAATEFPYQWVRIYYGDDRKHLNAIHCDFAFAFQSSAGAGRRSRYSHRTPDTFCSTICASSLCAEGEGKAREGNLGAQSTGGARNDF